MGLNDFSTIAKATKEDEKPAISFNTVVDGLLNKVNDAQIKSENSIEAFIKGDSNITMHEVMLNAKEGQMALEMATTIRNQVVELYQEVNRLQL